MKTEYLDLDGRDKKTIAHLGTQIIQPNDLSRAQARRRLEYVPRTTNDPKCTSPVD